MANKKWFDGVTYAARDTDWWWGFDHSSRDAEIQSVTDYFLRYTERGITDFGITLFEQISTVPSEVFLWQGEKYKWTHEHGGIPAPKEYEAIAPLWKAYREYGLDPIQICIDVMRSHGIRPWMTLRMNDAHNRTDSPEEAMWYTNLYKDEFFFEQLEKGHMIGADYGYFRNCYDFTYDEIREKYLAYIKESLDKYDFDGVDLDFQRELFCFDFRKHPDCHKIMTQFIRDIRALLHEEEKRVGHVIRLLVRTHRSPVDSFKMGFDVKTWVAEGLVDAIAPSPRWECTDSSIPLREWRALVGNDVGLFPGFETLHLHFSHTEADQVRAYAAAFFAEGADGLYFSNYVLSSYAKERDFASWAVKKENCTKDKRRFTLTFQDIAFTDEPGYRPLPLKVEGKTELPLEIGQVTKEHHATLVVDFEGETALVLSVGDLVNLHGTPCDPVFIKSERENGPYNITPHTPLAYDLTGLVTDSPITLTFEGTGTIGYLNIDIE